MLHHLGHDCALLPAEPANSPVLLKEAQLANIGQQLLTVLMQMKHNGAVDKTQSGFVAVTER